MTANDIYQQLLQEANCIRSVTCDGLIAGDPGKTVHKAATCFKLTAEVLQSAIRQNVDMIITHEPTFSRGDRREDASGADLAKWEILDRSGIALYRFHDHAHDSDPDYIHAGFLRDLELIPAESFPLECLGVRRYRLTEPICVRDIVQKIRNKLKLEGIRIVGNEDHPVKVLCLGLGSVGQDQIDILLNKECDMFITGETGEVCTAESVRDACFYGAKKVLLLLGHYSAEFSGMRLLAESLNERLIPALFLEGNEVFQYR